MAGGRLTPDSGLEGYWWAPRIVGKPRRPSAGRYKAPLTNLPEGRRRSDGCMEENQGQEARGYSELPLPWLSTLTFSMFTNVGEKIHFQFVFTEYKYTVNKTYSFLKVWSDNGLLPMCEKHIKMTKPMWFDLFRMCKTMIQKKLIIMKWNYYTIQT